MLQLRLQMETINNFLNRIYANFTDDIVLVYPRIIGKLIPDKWSIKQAKEYVEYLKKEEVVV